MALKEFPNLEEDLLLAPGSAKISQRWWRSLFDINRIVASISPGVSIFVGSGSPNTVVTANPGSLYLNTAGGAATTLWVKESGTGTNTGWVGK